MDSTVLARVSGRARASADAEAHLASTLRGTLDWSSGEALFAGHRRRLRAWRSDSCTPPPVLGLLGYMVLIAMRMDRDREISANAYYVRFAQTTGGSGGEDSVGIVREAFDMDALRFWKALNRWIDAAPEVRGKATAAAYDRRSLIGPALSQALVRDTDRRALRSLFPSIGLRPRQVVEQGEMERLLKTWITGDSSHRALVRLARSEELRPHLAEVAVAEVANWTGAEAETDTGTSAIPLCLTGRITRSGRPKLVLGLAVRPSTPVDLLKVPDDAPQAARSAIGDAKLTTPGPTGWRQVQGIVAGDVLNNDLRTSAAGACASRECRPVSVLEMDEEAGIYREVPQARLGARSLLLCASGSADAVADELDEIARPGWKRSEPHQLVGTPSGWVAFDNVELTRISNSRRPDLQVLVPRAWIDVTFTGGLKLPEHETYLRGHAPEVNATVPAGRRLAAVLVADGDGDGDGEHHEDVPRWITEVLNASDERAIALLGVGVDAMSLPLDELELRDGDYRLRLFDFDEERPLISRRLRLRSADTPLRRPTLACAERRRGDSYWPLSARLHGEEEAPAGEEAYDEIPEPARIHATTEGPACFARGAHRYRLPPGERTRKRATRVGVCSDCGHEKRFYPARPDQAPLQPSPNARVRAGSTEVVGGDLALELLSAVRSGPAGAVSRMLSAAERPALEAWKALTRLSALSHVDVELDRHLRPRRWSIRPAQLELVGERVVLTGERPARLLEALQEMGVLEEMTNGDGPRRLQIDAPVNEVEDLAREAAARAAVDVTVTDRAGHALLASLLAFRTRLRERLPRVPSLPANAELRWAGSWRRPGTRSGEVRVAHPVQQHFSIFHPDIRRGDKRVVAWIPREPDDLFAFDSSARTLSVPLGLEPPWLYERALVGCSGLLPRKDPDGGRTVYSNIHPDTAATLRRLVTGGLHDR